MNTPNRTNPIVNDPTVTPTGITTDVTNSFDRLINNIEHLKLSNVGNVPIHYKTYTVTVGQAVVDEPFLPIVSSLGPWYLADVRVPSCPRIMFFLPGYGKKVFPLNRLIATLVTMMRANHDANVPMLTREQAWLKSVELSIPQIRFRTRNPYDCRLQNLLIGYQISEAPLETLNTPDLEPKVITDPVDTDFEQFFSGKPVEQLPSNSSEIIAPKGSEFVNDLSALLRAESTDTSNIVKQAKL